MCNKNTNYVLLHYVHPNINISLSYNTEKQQAHERRCLCVCFFFMDWVLLPETSSYIYLYIIHHKYTKVHIFTCTQFCSFLPNYKTKVKMQLLRCLWQTNTLIYFYIWINPSNYSYMYWFFSTTKIRPKIHLNTPWSRITAEAIITPLCTSLQQEIHLCSPSLCSSEHKYTIYVHCR